jgi:hypothetical protein
VIRLFRPGGVGELASAQYFLDEGVQVTTLAVTPNFAADRRLWAATNRGVFVSPDAGVTWMSQGEAWGERPCVGLVPLADEAALLAIELGGTAWLSSPSAGPGSGQ